MATAGKYARAYAMCAGVFCLLLLLVSLVPKAAIRQQVEESAQILVEEGDYPRAWPTMHGSPDGLDSFTTSLSLNIAIHAVQNPVWGAVACAYYTDPSAESMAQNLQRGIDFPAQNTYAHYWHGYLVLLVPLLTVFDIAQIRKLFLLAAVLLVAALAVLLGRKTRMGAVLSLFVALLFCNLWIVAESTAQFFCFCIALVAMLYVTCRSREDAALGEDVSGLFFFVVGAVTVYLDFLDTPAVALGLPLATYVALHERQIRSAPLATTLLCVAGLAVSWAAGYALLWATKWAIGVLALGGHEAASLLSTIQRRSSTAPTDGGEVSRYDVLRYNISTMVPAWMLRCAKVLGVAWVAVTCLFHRKGWGRLCVPLLFVALIPVVWYCALPNHSTDHLFFTYRNVGVSIFALGLMATYLTDWDGLRGRFDRLRLPWHQRG